MEWDTRAEETARSRVGSWERAGGTEERCSLRHRRRKVGRKKRWVSGWAGGEVGRKMRMDPKVCWCRERKHRLCPTPLPPGEETEAQRGGVTLTGLPSSLEAEAGLGCTWPQDLCLRWILYKDQETREEKGGRWGLKKSGLG